jgi:hypothetical protein
MQASQTRSASGDVASRQLLAVKTTNVSMPTRFVIPAAEGVVNSPWQQAAWAPGECQAAGESFGAAVAIRWLGHVA